MNSWKFSPSLGQDRLEALNNAPPFEEIARSVVSTMHIQCSHVDPCDEAGGFHRFVGCVVIDRTLFDIFFNSQNGYRGCYFQSPDEGVRMNAKLLGLLAPGLLEFQEHNNVSIDLLSASLHAPSGKSWLAEVGKGFCAKCEGDWNVPKDDPPEILNGRWEVSTAPNSRFGTKALFLETLRVMGGFVNEAEQEYVARRKQRRAEEIHDVVM